MSHKAGRYVVYVKCTYIGTHLVRRVAVDFYVADVKSLFFEEDAFSTCTSMMKTCECLCVLCTK